MQTTKLRNEPSSRSQVILEGLYFLLGCHKHKGHIRDGATECGHLQTELPSTADRAGKGAKQQIVCREQGHPPMMPASTQGHWPEDHQLRASLNRMF